jgi:2'-5' RNA ligase
MDDNEQEHDESIMIALLPTSSEWCHIALPHLTLVFCGKISFYEKNPLAFNDMCKDACTIAMLGRPLTLPVTTREKFGNWGDGEVDVFRLGLTPELKAMRNIVEQWTQSEFDFNPHVTIGPVGSPVPDPPKYISFRRIGVFWGRKQELTFNMGP